MATTTPDKPAADNPAQSAPPKNTSNGRDGPLDLVTALANAASTAAKRVAAGEPDPLVSTAFALGWQMAELYRPDRRRTADPADEQDLRGLGRLDQDEWIALGLNQVRAGVFKLSKSIEAAGLTVPNVANLPATIGDDAKRDEIRTFHVSLQSTLIAADFRLGKAYGLGRALADTTRAPQSVEKELADDRVSTLTEWTRDLATAFPPHAGHAVANSLEAWNRWSRSAKEDRQAKSSDLRTQGRTWRSLLSGEKRATDVLSRTDYITAGAGLIYLSRQAVGHFFRHYWWLAVLILALFGGGIAVMFAVGSPAAIGTGAAGVLASVGLSWKGVGATLGAAAARIEEPLWGAELDAVICTRISPGFVITAANGASPPA